MKKTLVFAIVLALVMAIAAPAFAETGMTAELKLAEKAEGFKYTAEGTDKAEKKDLENVLVVEVSVTGQEVCNGIAIVKFPAELTYAGYKTALFGAVAVNEPTLPSGTAGQIKAAMAGATAIEEDGVFFAVAFTYDAAAMAGKTVKVDVEIPELMDESGEDITMADFSAEYTFDTDVPTETPSETPSETPTNKPTTEPTNEPTTEPTNEPTTEPTNEPTQPGNSDNTGDNNGDDNNTVVPGPTGSASLVAVAVISVVAGLGAIALRKED